MVAIAVILAENYRAKRSRDKSADRIDAKFEKLEEEINALTQQVSLGSGGTHQKLDGRTLTEAVMDASSAGGTSPPRVSGDASNEALVRSMQMLWTLAAQHGWLDSSKKLPDAMRWAMKDDDQAGQNASQGALPAGAKTSPAPSSTIQQMAADRARAIVNEVYSSTAAPDLHPNVPPHNGSAAAGA